MLEIIHSGIHVAKNSKAVSSKDSRSSKEYFRASCNSKSNWDEGMNDKCTWLSIEVYRWMGIAKAMAQSLERTS